MEEKPELSPEAVLTKLGIEFFPRTNRLQFCCPLHNDHDPSSAFYQDTGLAHCWVCEYTYPPLVFYSKVRQVSLEEAKASLEKEFNVPDYSTPSDPLKVAKARSWGEDRLKENKPLMSRLPHAQAGETLDRLMLAYAKGQLGEEKFDKALKIWYNKYLKGGGADELLAGRIPETGTYAGLEEGAPEISGFGREEDLGDLEESPTDESVDLD